MRDLIGHTLGHYRIVEKIGEGGMGEVYRAHDERLDRDVAVKVIHESVAQDADRLARFEREAKAVAKLDHPNILAIYDFGSDEGVTYAITELLDGQNLRQSIPASGMAWQKVVEIGAAIADGLAAAHGKGIVHRDLKPENVFVTSDGRVKVLDFGLAKVKVPVEEEAETATLTPAGTVAGTVMGTMGYMSPEQLRGEPSDARSDIFALGCVLYEMSSGKTAFLRNSAAETTAAILKEEPERLSSKGVVLPVDVERSVHRCLEKSPDARFQSSADLAFALRSISTDQAVPRTKPTGERVTRRRKGLQAVAVVSLVVLGAVAAMFGLGVFEHLDSLSEADPIHSLAVLPLENLTGDADQAYLVDGLHEELIATFAQIPAFDKVIARTSVMPFRGSGTPIQEIGERLGVQVVLEGSVRRSGDTIRATLQLIDARTESHLWADSFERNLTDILVLQSEVAQAVVGEIQLALTPEQIVRLADRRTVDPEAYTLYLKGRYHWGQFNKEALERSRRYFQQAIAKDPTFARGYLGLAMYYTSSVYFSPGVSIHENAPRILSALKKAISLDDSLAMAYAVLGWHLTFYEWDWAAAEEAFKRSLELNEGSADAHMSYSVFLGSLGRHEEAVVEAARARELDPLSLRANNNLARSLLFSGQVDSAIDQVQETLELGPDFMMAHFVLGVALLHKASYEEAVTALQRADELSRGGDLRPKSFLVRAFTELGRFDDARRVSEELERNEESQYVPPMVLANAAFAMGDMETGFEWLEKAFDDRDPNLAALFHTRFFDFPAEDPRFQNILRQMNFPEN